MGEQGSDPRDLRRRDFLKASVAGGAAAATPALPQSAQAQASGAPLAAAGYMLLNIDEAAFVEALVDHMVPADGLSPKGTDIGINIYIDRALAGGWGKGERLYIQGPWKPGTPSQGYQLPLTPAQLYRAGIEATNAHCIIWRLIGFPGVIAVNRENVEKFRDRKFPSDPVGIADMS